MAEFSPRPHPKKFIFWMCLLPFLPDLDSFGLFLGVPYGSFWGHRGFTHSILFGFFLAFLAIGVSKQLRTIPYFFCLAAAAISHGVLDGLTDGGLGVAYFAPFDNTRYFFPWRPILVSPMGPYFLSHQGILVLLDEALKIALPCAILIFINLALRKKPKEV